MKLFMIEHGKYPFVIGDKSSIDVDGYDVIGTENKEFNSMNDAIKFAKLKFKQYKFCEGIDEVHQYFTRLYLTNTDENTAMETIEVKEGKMIDDFGFGNFTFHSFDEYGKTC